MDPLIIILLRWNPRILIYQFSLAADGPSDYYITSLGPQEFIYILSIAADRPSDYYITSLEP